MFYTQELVAHQTLKTINVQYFIQNLLVCDFDCF